MPLVARALTDADVDEISALSDPAQLTPYEQEIEQRFESAADRGEAYMQVGLLWEQLNNPPRARVAFDKAVLFLESLPPSLELVESLLGRSYADMLITGEKSRYCPDREQAVALAEKVGDKPLLVKALILRAFCYSSAEHYEQGLADL